MSHVVQVSSNANNGANAGTFNVNANNDSSIKFFPKQLRSAL
jgi:hypothetical protein